MLSAKHWAVRAADTFLTLERPKGDDFGEVVEALLYVNETDKVRQVTLRHLERLDRAFKDPEHFAPIQAGAYLAVAHAWASLRDRAALEDVLAKADAATEEADQSMVQILRWEKARALARIDLDRAIELVQGLEQRRRPSGFVDLAFMLATMKDGQGIERTLALAREAAETSSDRHEASRVSADAVGVWLNAGDVEAALAAAEKVEDEGRRIVAYHRVARAFQRSGKADRAGEVLQKIKALADGADADAAAMMALNFASAAAEQGRGAEALEAVRRAEQALQQVKGRGRRVEGSSALAQAYASAGDADAARRMIGIVREALGPKKSPPENPFEVEVEDESVPPEDRLPPWTIIDGELAFTAAALAMHGRFDEAMAMAETVGRQDRSSAYMWIARGAAIHGKMDNARGALERVNEEVTRPFTARVVAEVLAARRRAKDLADWVGSQPAGRARLWAELGAAEGLAGRQFSDPVIR